MSFLFGESPDVLGMSPRNHERVATGSLADVEEGDRALVFVYPPGWQQPFEESADGAIHRATHSLFSLPRPKSRACTSMSRVTWSRMADRKSVRPFAAVGTGEDFAYTARCPWIGCGRTFGGSIRALGDRLCPHCKQPIRVHDPNVPR